MLTLGSYQFWSGLSSDSFLLDDIKKMSHLWILFKVNSSRKQMLCEIHLRQVDNIKQDFVLSPGFFKAYKLIVFTGTLQEESGIFIEHLLFFKHF